MAPPLDVLATALTGEELRRRSLDLLEFPRVRETLASHTHLPIARELALSLTPAYDAEAVRRRQQETAEARLLLDETGEVDLATDRDVRPVLRRALLDGVLTGEELVAVADSLELVRRAKAIGSRLQGKTPLLRATAKSIPDMRSLERAVRSKVAPSGELLDDATAYLRQLRQEVRAAYEKAVRPLERLIGSDLGHEVLQERLVTVRAERLVVPVKAELRRRLPGIVHDVSDSGATLFIEPLSNVTLCNTWRERAAEEAEESLRVRRQLSSAVARRAAEAGEALEQAARLDLALAKARYAQVCHAAPVRTADDPTPGLHLVEARHPLLPGSVVPVSMALEGPVAGLVITGPNMGGKTVALKTLGLLALMHQAGLQPPAEAPTVLPVFDGVYADIGDQQDIERSVSTFSSHISNIARILDAATPRSLVLLDELGTSTDPEEGSALAKAVLAHLADRGVRTVVTTHHRTVAAFVEEQEALENASVELDPETLLPTYKLTMGLPGRSYALAVAERLKLDPQVVRAAKEFQDPGHQATEALLEGLQAERHRTRKQLHEAEEAQQRAAALQQELEQRLEELAQAQERVVEETRQGLLAQAKEVLAALRRAEAAATWEPPPPRVTDEARREVAEVQRRLRSRLWGRTAPAPSQRGRLTAGDLVEVGALGFTGTVLALPTDDRKVEVLIGSARVLLPASRLRKVGTAAVPATKPTTSVRLDSGRPVLAPEPELDLRGMRLHEALERLDSLLDQALAQGRRNLRVIHGRGTGTLRQGVWKHLAHHPAVERYDFAGRERGGDGATLVELG